MSSRRVLFPLGLVLVIVGLVLVGYFAWQFYGTNIVAKQKQEKNVEQLTALWEKGDPATPSAEDGEISIGEASALIRIPAFGKDYVMPVLEGTSDDVLAQGFAHFEQSANPGQVGNYALAAHRITHGEPLRRMPELRPGDKVLVETRRAIYTYELDTDPNDLVVPFTAGWVVDEFPVNPDAGGVTPDPRGSKRLITLTTCSELFHTDNRLIAFGHLVDVEQKKSEQS
ncbi:MAG TPA: class E sortase [Nocardioidaceae bacterium]|nr:class E sortase [Nocardioidaceae bacterium]